MSQYHPTVYPDERCSFSSFSSAFAASAAAFAAAFAFAEVVFKSFLTDVTFFRPSIW